MTSSETLRDTPTAAEDDEAVVPDVKTDSVPEQPNEDDATTAPDVPVEENAP